MSAESTFPDTMAQLDQEIAKALVLLFKLSDDAIDRILEAMTHMGTSFSEAALHTGLVTMSELEAARQWLGQERAIHHRGIIEEALRKQSGRREIMTEPEEWVTPGPGLLLAHNPDTARSETIRTLRTELLMRTNGLRDAGVFAIVSPGAGEGRSQLSAELALAFAQLGGRTLLVDADLRRPHLHSLFGATNDIGLAQALTGNGNARLRRVSGPLHMSLVTSGPPPLNPLELLSSRSFERLVADWRRAFEYVVIDTPPVSEFSDGVAVATVASNLVVMVRANETSFHGLTEMRRKLDTTRARVVGAVISNY